MPYESYKPVSSGSHEGAQYLRQMFGPMARAKDTKEKYDATLDVIRHGFVVFEPRARELAKAHNLDTKDLPDAVVQGEKNLLLRCAEEIAFGNLPEPMLQRYTERGKELAKKMGLNLDEIVEDIIINSAPI